MTWWWCGAGSCALGAARALVTSDRWWRSGAETLLLGAVVAFTAYGAGLLVRAVSGGVSR